MALADRIRIEVSIPRRSAGPNSKSGSRFAKTRIHGEQKVAMVALVRSRYGAGFAPKWKRAALGLEVHHNKSQRAFDPDNLTAACKGYIDGLVAAHVLDDDRDLLLLPPMYVPTNSEGRKLVIHARGLTQEEFEAIMGACWSVFS